MQNSGLKKQTSFKFEWQWWAKLAWCVFVVFSNFSYLPDI